MRFTRVLLGACWLVLGLVGPAWSMEHYTDTLQDPTGTAIVSATVHVYVAGTLTHASLYSDNGVTVKANPFQTGSVASGTPGVYDFYASNGVYDLVFQKTGYTFSAAKTARIALFDLNDGGGGGGGGSSAFSDLLTGTNTTATMVVSTGANLTVSGTGTVNANRYNGNATVAVAHGGTNLTSAGDDAVMVGNGATWELKTLPSCPDTTGNHLNYTVSTNTWSCGTTAPVTSFSALTTGSNTTATMTVGSGASLGFSGTGVLNASTHRGNAVIAVADGGTNLTVAADDAVMVGSGTTWISSALPGCNNPVTSKLLYDTGTNAFSCGTDQSVGGGTTFDTIGSGTNTTATMQLGSGSTLATIGTGANVANLYTPNTVVVNAGNSPLSVNTSHALIVCDTTAGARIVNLSSASFRTMVLIKNLGANTCTINRAGADTIDGGTSAVLRTVDEAVTLVSDATSRWEVF